MGIAELILNFSIKKLENILDEQQQQQTKEFSYWLNF